ncbi:MAG: hypothetical protein K2I95_00825 [Treponemataceae bacterium]|nr:hypothetical protein [Treponemataceae bacterium]
MSANKMNPFCDTENCRMGLDTGGKQRIEFTTLLAREFKSTFPRPLQGSRKRNFLEPYFYFNFER